MVENDEWATDPETGEILVSRFSGFATAAAPDGSLALLRLTMFDGAEGDIEAAVQLVLRPAHVRDLINALTDIEAALVLKAKPAGSA
jgi:hypothetical protein